MIFCARAECFVMCLILCLEQNENRCTRSELDGGCIYELGRDRSHPCDQRFWSKAAGDVVR